MIYYSVIPAEQALQDPASTGPDYREVEVEGVLMTVEMVGEDARIVRLHSPDLAHYLNPRFQPGNKVTLS
ncbi:YlzJ-like family protein [Salinithrix halophila]|uniref:YlzJ-like family protein n=1 Tax=Salinithrix halophila TaxID=1485204 RepID=A0ABV8JPI7_9BACL